MRELRLEFLWQIVMSRPVDGCDSVKDQSPFDLVPSEKVQCWELLPLSASVDFSNWRPETTTQVCNKDGCGALDVSSPFGK